MLLPLSVGAYIPDGFGQFGNYGRTPNGIVDLRTGKMVEKKQIQEIEAVARYFPDVFDEAIAVFKCESGISQFRKDGSVVTSPTNDYGLAQINKVHLRKAESLGQDVFTMTGNLGFARYLYDLYGWEPWVCKSVLAIASSLK